MSVRNPKNQVKLNLRTEGGEFVIKSSGLDYIGPYYLVNNQAYAGTDPVSSRLTTVKETPTSIPVIKQIEPVELDVNPDLLPPGADTNLLASLGNAAGFFTQAYAFAKSNLETAKLLKDKVFPSKSVKTGDTSKTPRTGFHYYTQALSDPNKAIKETDLTNFNILSKDPIYTTVAIDFSSADVDKQIEEGNKKLPGLKTFLEL